MKNGLRDMRGARNENREHSEIPISHCELGRSGAFQRTLADYKRSRPTGLLTFMAFCRLRCDMDFPGFNGHLWVVVRPGKGHE